MDEDPKDKELDEYAPAYSDDEDPVFHDDETIHLDETKGTEVPAHLRGLLLQLGFDKAPMYHTKRISRQNHVEWHSTNFIYHNDRPRDTHFD